MRVRSILVSVFVLALTACGGKGSEGTSEPVTPTPQKTVLSISSYGQGQILDQGVAIACASHTCSKEYTAGMVVSLTATPEPGWVFDHWSGCDTVAASQCTVTMSKVRTVAPVFLRSVETKLQANVLTLDAADLAALAKNEAGVLTFTNAAPNVAAMTVGTVLHSTTGEGLARRVTHVVSLPGGNAIVETTAVALTDVVAQGSFYFNSAARLGAAATPRGARALRVTRLAPGVKPAANWSGEYDKTFTTEVDLKIDEKIHIKGAIDLSVNVEGAADVSFPGVLNEFRLAVNPTIEPSLTVTGTVGEWKKPLELAAFVGVPIVMGPVVLVPEFILKIDFEGKLEVEVNFLSRYKGTASAGFAYVKGHGVNPIWSGGFDPSPFNPPFTGKVSLDVMAGLEAGVRLWGVAGPKAMVGPYLNIEAAVSTADFCARAHGELGFRATIGGDVKIASWELGELEWTIGEVPMVTLFDVPLMSACNATPAAPRNVAVANVDAHALRLNWQAPAAEAAVVAYEVYRDDRFVTRTSALTILDTGLEAGKSYCYDVRSRDVNSKLSVAGGPVCRTTMAPDNQAPSVPVISSVTALSTTSLRLQWVASSDNLAVGHYTVLLNGAALQGATGPQADVLRLRAGTRYCFTVRANDAAGNVSASSAEVCGTTLSPDLAAWTLMLKCADRTEYVVTKNIDIDLQSPSNISVAGEATDYNGAALTYHLFGGYEGLGGIFQGKINWAFANTSSVREDEFSIGLNTLDTGDVPMNQVKGTGCDAAIRLKRN